MKTKGGIIKTRETEYKRKTEEKSLLFLCVIMYILDSLCLKRLRPIFGRAVAQAVSRWLPTAEARVRVREACGVCSGQSGTGADFLQLLRFPLSIIPPISPSS
jgi:hypothetical protein